MLLAQLLAAQADVVIIIHSTGKVWYYAPNQNEPKPIYPGARLEVDGKVRCEANANLKLLYDGKTIQVPGGKTYSLRDLTQQFSGGPNMGFTGRFWAFINGSMKETQDDKTLEENHRKHMESVRAGVKGYARQQYAIRSNLLFSGTLSAVPVTFQWTRGTPGQSYMFWISSEKDRRMIVQAYTRDTFFQVDLSQLALDPGGSYEWVVF
jgi:hypothetical protein